MNMMMLLYDCELTCDIYIRKNTDRINDLEQILNSDLDDNANAIYQYRLAKLYYYDKKIDMAKELLKKARNNTQDKNARNKIDQILKGNWNLL